MTNPGSEVSFGDTPVTGSVTGTFLGAEPGEVSFVGSASWADTSQTASVATIAETSSIVLGGVESASFADTASIVLGGIESATFAATAAFTETASIATNAETASLAETALTAETASFVESASFADQAIVAQQASQSISSSFADQAIVAQQASQSISSSFAQTALAANTASFAVIALAAISASFAEVALAANSASFAEVALVAISASFADNAILAQNATSSISASFGTITGSFLGSDSASVSFVGSASFANAATSASTAQTASLAIEALSAPLLVPIPAFMDQLRLNNVKEPIEEVFGAESTFLINLTNHLFSRLSVAVTIPADEGGRPRLGMQYSLNQTDWSFLDGVDGPYADITGSPGEIVRVAGPVVAHVSESRTDVFLRAVTYSGSASAPFESPVCFGLFWFLQIVEGQF